MRSGLWRPWLFPWREGLLWMHASKNCDQQTPVQEMGCSIPHSTYCGGRQAARASDRPHEHKKKHWWKPWARTNTNSTLISQPMPHAHRAQTKRLTVNDQSSGVKINTTTKNADLQKRGKGSFRLQSSKSASRNNPRHDAFPPPVLYIQQNCRSGFAQTGSHDKKGFPLGTLQ